MTRVAVDVLGGGSPPERAMEALLEVVKADPDLVLTIATTPDTTIPGTTTTERAAGELGDRAAGVSGRLSVKPATRPVTAGADAVRQVRAYRDSGIRVAARLVRDGQADALVSCAPLEAAVAGAQFTLGLLPGATQPSAAVVVATHGGPVVLSDVGAVASASADQLVQHATTAAAFAAVLLGKQRPKVGLLGGRGVVPDVARRGADALLSSMLEASDVDYVGVVSARQILTGTDVDVVVTDGATGEIVSDLLDELGPGRRPGVTVLGVGAPAVALGRGCGAESTAGDLVAAVELAVHAVRSGLSDGVRAGLNTLRASRRASFGLAP